MLIKGLGRVEGTVEDLQPVTLKQLIPLDLLDSFIGIYWHVGKGKFIIYKAPLLDAKYAVVEMGQDYDEQSNTDDLQIDYNVFHMDIWYEDVLKKEIFEPFAEEHGVEVVLEVGNNSDRLTKMKNKTIKIQR